MGNKTTLSRAGPVRKHRKIPCLICRAACKYKTWEKQHGSIDFLKGSTVSTDNIHGGKITEVQCFCRTGQ